MKKSALLYALAATSALSLGGFNHFPSASSYERYKPENPERDAEALRKAQEKRDRKAAKRLVK